MAFTEEGVAMLSSVLRSKTAIEVAFAALREYSLGYSELNRKLEHFMIETNMQFHDIYQALTELASNKNRSDAKRIPKGFKTNKND